MALQRRPITCTEVCGIFSPSVNDPPLQPTKRRRSTEVAQYHCPRCDTTCLTSFTLKRHFPSCIKLNGNPDSLRWFDNVTNHRTVTQTSKAAIILRTHKPSEVSLASVLADEPGATRAMSKVEKWAAMTGKHAATIASTPNNLKSARSSAPADWTGATGSATDKSRSGNTPTVHKPALTPFTTPKKGVRFASPLSRDNSVTPSREQQQSGSRSSRKLRQISHNENTSHLFNNAGLLMPSIPGVDSVTERLFDKGEIMSLGPSRSHDGYYPDGQLRGGSFLLRPSNEKKRKRIDEGY